MKMLETLIAVIAFYSGSLLITRFLYHSRQFYCCIESEIGRKGILAKEFLISMLFGFIGMTALFYGFYTGIKVNFAMFGLGCVLIIGISMTLKRIRIKERKEKC